MVPQIVRRIHRREQLPGRLCDGFELGQQRAAKLAVLDVRMVRRILSGADQFGQLRLEVGAAHGFEIVAHSSASCVEWARKASRNFNRALCSCDLLLPMEQSSIAAISLCSYPSTS